MRRSFATVQSGEQKPQLLALAVQIVIFDPILDPIPSTTPPPLSPLACWRRRIITTPDGQAGVLFKQGELEVLPPGRVTRNDPTNFFAGFLSTGQQTLPIAEISLLSADMVGLELDAAVTVQIVDAKLAVTMLGSSGPGAFESTSGPGSRRGRGTGKGTSRAAAGGYA